MNTHTSRRNFLKTGTMVALGTSVSSTALANGAMGSSPCCKSASLKFGLASFTTRAFSLEETIGICRQLDLDYLSLKDVFHLPVGESPETLKQMTSKIQEAGLELYAGGVHYMRTKEAIDTTFEYAQLTGIGLLVSVVPYDLLSYTNQKIKETGISVGIHNHGPTDEVYPTPESAYERIKDLDPRFGLCIDLGHTQRAGVCPANDIMRFKDRLLDVHLKDVTESTAAGATVEMGRGVVDIPAVLKALLKIDYQGISSFEYEKDEKNPVPGLAESVGYVRGVLRML